MDNAENIEEGRTRIPVAPLTYFNDGGGGGGGDRGSYYIPQKIITSEFVYPKKSLLFIAYPKKSLSPFFATPQKSLCFSSRPKKIPASFIDQKKSFLPKFQTQKITQSSSTLTYVSGAPWTRMNMVEEVERERRGLNMSGQD